MKPIVLTILDGWGYSPQKHGNAILYAKTPFIDSVQRNFPSTLLQASGKAVGMTWGEAGNSEVGHLTIGAGRTIFQYLSRINKAIENGDFFQNKALLGAINHAKENYSTLHIAGLLTSGSVHSHINHLFAIINLAAKNEFSNVRIHLFTDGKDSGLKESPSLIEKLQTHMAKVGVGTITTVMGRDYAMDRGKNWDKTRKAYELLVNGVGDEVKLKNGDGSVNSEDIIQKIKLYYEMGHIDSDIPPFITDKQGVIKNRDALVFFNFREDSMRQITTSFTEKNFDIFPVQSFDNLFVVSMTQYLEDPNINVAFSLPEVKNNLAEILSLNNKKQLHIAESEKYAHVTYFFNGLKNLPYPGETDIFIESAKNHDANSKMRAPEIADKVLEHLNQDQYDFYIINFANSDILSHTGDLERTIGGVEVVDGELKKIADAVLDKDGIMIITADHGNAESMVYELTGEKRAAHEESPVPFYLLGRQFQKERSQNEVNLSFSQVSGILSDVAPTILELLGIEKPVEMTGESLLKIIK